LAFKGLSNFYNKFRISF